MPVLHYRKDATSRREGNYYVVCHKDDGFQTWQLSSMAARCLVANDIFGGGEVSWPVLNLFIKSGLAYLHDPEGAKERWQKKIDVAIAEDPVSADAKYGRILAWLEAQKRKNGSN